MKVRALFMAWLASITLVAATLLTVACSGGGADLTGGLPGTGNPGGGGVGSDTGSVAVLVKDAPLSALQSFTIDVSTVTLRGAGVADVQVYPTSSSTGSMTIDLLSLQALNQVLSSTQVPVGSYSSIEMVFANPQAVDNNNVAQNIQSTGSTLLGYFAPQLQVSSGSSQTVQIDIDLRQSVIDLGGNNVLFTPTVVVQVTNQPVVLQQFPMIVTSVNSANFSFVGDLALYHTTAGFGNANGGSLTVNTSNTTTYSNGNGSVITGNVTAHLQATDLVLVDGTMLNGVVDATGVVEISTPVGNPTFPSNRAMIDATITAVDTSASTVTARVQYYYGPSGGPARFSSVSVDVDSQTMIHRMGQNKALADLVPGNRCFINAEINGSAYEADEISEDPATVQGSVVSITQGTSAGMSLLTFNLVNVDQIAIAQLPFLPTQMTADIPTGMNLQNCSSVILLGFFDGTTHFVDFGKVHPGFPNGGGTTGGGNAGGFPGGVIGAPVSYGLIGERAASSTASVSNGNLVFDLDTLTNTNMGSATYAVTVPASAMIEKISANGQISALTQSQAAADINSSTAYELYCEGSMPPGTSTFSCDISLLLIDKAFSRGGGNTGGGGNPGGGGGGNIPPNATVAGNVVGTASLNNANEIVFSLDMGFNLFGNSSTTVAVRVTSAASLLSQQPRFGVPGTILGGSPITQAEMLAALNNNPETVVCEGQYDSANQTYVVDLRLTVIPREYYYAGDLTASTSAAINGNNEIEFSLTTVNMMTQQTLVLTVTVPASALLGKGSPNGNVQTLTQAEMVTALNAANALIHVIGSADRTTSNAFTANIEVFVIDMSNTGGGFPGGNPGGGNTTPPILSGTVSGTASLTGTGAVTFTMLLQPPQQLPNVGSVTVVCDPNQPIFLIDPNDPFRQPTMLSAQAAVAALNANPTVVTVYGNYDANTATITAVQGMDIVQ